MSGMWVYLKENVKCGTKLSDVLCMPEKCSNRKQDDFSDHRIVQPIATPIRELIFRQNYSQTWLLELEIGNPSRKIVEIIFRKASIDPSKSHNRIRSVLKVKNSIQSIERFEKYRETVKMRAYGKFTKHPRSAVDGNEQLRFFGTTMTCRSERPKQLSQLCTNPNCRVCLVLGSNFRDDFRFERGIRLSSCSKYSSELGNPVAAMKNSERAVIVCRTIAGSSLSIENGEYDEKQWWNLGNNVMVCNPSAVLPCFVIVFH